jgi:hypothetical protein
VFAHSYGFSFGNAFLLAEENWLPLTQQGFKGLYVNVG